jgi:hypothetical protein
MSAAVEIAKWVKDKPMILIRFDETFSESLNNSRQGFEHLTIVKPHSVFQDFKLPTICLMEIHDYPTTKCYLATATRRKPVSTFDSRLTSVSLLLNMCQFMISYLKTETCGLHKCIHQHNLYNPK